MAISTLDGLIGGTKDACIIWKNGSQPAVAANVWASYWAATAIPAAGTLAVGNTTSGVIPTNATTGAAAFVQPVGAARAYAMAATVFSTVTGTVMLYDRAFHIGAFTPTAGAYSGVTGTPVDRPSAGDGMEIWAEIVTALSAAAHTLTITYTNSAGTSGRTATVTLPASAPIARMFPVTLQAGDSGVRQITAISGSSSPPTGTFNLLIARPILRVGVVANVPARLGIPETGLRPLFPSSCLALAFYNAAGTTAPSIQVSLDLTTG